MRLSILIFCLFHGTCWTSNHYCIYQPKTVHVKEGDSVTIPCTYTYPERYGGESQIIIYWGESNGSYCSYMKKNITDNSGNVVDEYKERISRVTHPDHRTESLIIRGLKYTDGDRFCCTATMYRTVGDPYIWSDFFGTSLIFEDGDKLYQVEELMAVPGEEMVIPCNYSQETLGEATQVTWYRGDHELCADNEKDTTIYNWDSTHPGAVYPYSLVNPPLDISLRIHRVQGNEYRHYCCRVITRKGVIERGYGTELIITDYQSSAFNVTQPYTITGHRGESVALSCSYTSFMERDVLGVTIYWRLGNLSGPYVYHHYKEMVHPGYRGRTGIQGAADLHIQGVKMSDDSMYYCFVIIRLCTGFKKYEKEIQYGGGTRFIVTDKQSLVLIGSISGAVLLLLLCVIILILKTTGVICKKKTVPDVMETSDSQLKVTFTLEEKPYCEISTKNTEHDEEAESKEGKIDKKRMKSEKDDEERENILYSELNKTKLQQRSPSPYQRPEEDTVYTTVRGRNV
ncbi:uncharacterized protein LOC130367587 [Hyla sarda]|uniref:uncharacterized protein LOC130367587 n=1 Tax=Hyla sarda TaxID=327740 RepID=UPI0024C3D9F5|nr:uncharacterized protein LOC130367587 [Hyla sarda]